MARTADHRLSELTKRDDSRRVAVLVGVLFGISSMGPSAPTVVLTPMADALGVDVSTTVWTVSVYVLVLAVATALHGRISDLVGVRLPLAAGIGLMSLGALVAACAPGYAWHLAGRVVQGLGAAAVPTLGVAALTARYDGALRSRALGWMAGAGALVGGMGPLVGGAVEAVLGWRGVMAVPVVALLVLPWVWHALHGEGHWQPLDLVGAALVMLAAGGLVLLVQSLSASVVLAVTGAALLMTGAPALAWWIRRRPQGFLPLAVVRNDTVVRSAVASASLPAGWFAVLVAIPAVLVSRGWEPWHVGLLLVPGALTGLVMPRLAAFLMETRGAVTSLLLAALGCSVSLLLAAAGVALGATPLLVLALVAMTPCFTVGQPALLRAVGDAVAERDRGVALGLAMLLFLTGGSVGSAVVGGLGGWLGFGWSLLVLALLTVLAGLQLLPEACRRGGPPVCGDAHPWGAGGRPSPGSRESS